MPKKTTDPRNRHRGTRPSQFRLGPAALADLDAIAAHLSARAAGARIPRSEAVRLAISELARRIRRGELPENAGG